RVDPVTNAGHADLVEAPDGRWWAVFLGSRPYEKTHFNTGRETFLLPVTWVKDWPVILRHGEVIPYVAPAPAVAAVAAAAAAAAATEPLTGNFTWRDDFNSPALQPEWLQVRVPKAGAAAWADLTDRPGWLTLHPLPLSLDALGNPSFLARRQQH